MSQSPNHSAQPFSYHLPVLLYECLDGLNIRPDGIYVDVTFSGGGHSRAILSRLGENGRLYAFDRDSDAAKNGIEDPRFTLIQENFMFLKNSPSWKRSFRNTGMRPVCQSWQ